MGRPPIIDSEPRTSAERTLLIVDDNAKNLAVVVQLLETAGNFVVLTARDGEAGLKRARLAKPSLILLDVKLPGMDGFSVCRQLRLDPETAAIPVIFMTALAEPEQKVRGFEAGGVDYVTKPVEARELLARVQTHLQLRALRDELERQNQTLEARVAERTAALERELEERAVRQREREQLLELLRVQGEQLRELTQGFLEQEKRRDRDFADALHEGVTERLELVRGHLESAERVVGTDAKDAAAKLRSALELLSPAQESTETVRGKLGVDAARADDPLVRLSTREYEILQLLAQGRQNKDIAHMLGIGKTTVSTYRLRIMEKLGVSDLPSLVRVVERIKPR